MDGARLLGDSQCCWGERRNGVRRWIADRELCNPGISFPLEFWLSSRRFTSTASSNESARFPEVYTMRSALARPRRTSQQEACQSLKGPRVSRWHRPCFVLRVCERAGARRTGTEREAPSLGSMLCASERSTEQAAGGLDANSLRPKQPEMTK